jgi:protein TonB
VGNRAAMRGVDGCAMYASGLRTRERGGALAAVIAVHAILALVLLNLSGAVSLTEDQRDLQVFDVTEVEPPPPPLEVQPEQERAPEEEGEASPPNIRSEATPVVAPEPEIRLPVTPPVIASPTPNQGADPTQGAAPVPGPGTGAGGTGTGTGAGGSGTGTGGGGGGVATGPRLVRGITNRDYPVQIQRRWPRGGAIFLRLRIQPNGRPSQCDVMRSYGDPVADQWTCSLMMERGLFRPAVNERGEPVAAWYGYVQRETGRFDR